VNNFRDIEKELDSLLPNTSPAVVGLGNLDRADDGFGIELVGRLKKSFPDIIFSELEKAVEGIVYDFLEFQFDLLIFADAVHFKGIPGELKIFNSKDIDRFVSPLSTHKVPLSLLMGLIQEHKKSSYLLGVQPASIEFRGNMTPEVSSSIDFLERYFKKFFRENLS